MSETGRRGHIKALFQEALDCPPKVRRRFLEEACEDDPELLQEVTSLLRSHDAAGSFIEEPGFVQIIEALAEEQTRDFEGERFGAYRAERLLGQGGMASVYLAVRADGAFSKTVAVKVIRQKMATPDLVRRFVAERQILADLEHPHIARLLDGGTTVDRLPYLIMEYVEGEPIDSYCDNRRLTIDERLDLFRKICDAVHFAHQRGIVHRDIKPANVLVTGDGTPKLLDFGIAKLLSPMDDETDLTVAGQRPMTPAYASPEQVRGGPLTAASDIYSLGVLLYLLLSGHRPYEVAGLSSAELERLVSETEPLTPSAALEHSRDLRNSERRLLTITPHSIAHSRRTDLTTLRRMVRGLDGFVLRALEKAPADRYASAAAFSEAVHRAAHALGEAPAGRVVNARWKGAVVVAAIGPVVRVAVALALAASATAALWLASDGARDEAVAPEAKIELLIGWPTNEYRPRISPDNRWVSFISDRGDQPQIWLKDLHAEAEARPLDGSGGVISHVWSPDGTEIAYLTWARDEAVLNVIPAGGGEPTLVVPVGRPVVDPSLVRWIGRSVYVHYNRSLWRLQLDRGGLYAVLSPTVDFRLDSVDVSADEERILFSSLRDGRRRLWVARLDGSDARSLVGDEFLQVEPRWLGRDGRGMIYISNERGRPDVWHINLPEGASRPLTSAPSEEYYAEPSADGSMLALQGRNDDAHLFLHDPVSGNSRQLTADRLDDFFASADSSGDTLAFQRLRPEQEYLYGWPFDGRIMVGQLRADRIEGERVVVNDGFGPLLAPDGLRLAYARKISREGLDLELRVLDVTTGADRLLIERFRVPGFFSHPLEWFSNGIAWSPDSTALRFVSRSEGGAYELRATSATGEPHESPVLLVNREPGTTIGDLMPSADGSRLAYVLQSIRTGLLELHEFDLPSRQDRILYSDAAADGLHPKGWTADARALVVLRVADNPDHSQRLDVLAIETGASATSAAPRRIATVDSVSGSGAQLDPRRDVLYLARAKGSIHDLHALSLRDGSLHQISHNSVPGVSFSGIEVLPDGRLLYSLHSRNSDIWIVRLDR